MDGVAPDVICYMHAIAACAEAGAHDWALVLLGDLKEEETADVQVYNAAIAACAKARCPFALLKTHCLQYCTSGISLVVSDSFLMIIAKQSNAACLGAIARGGADASQQLKGGERQWMFLACNAAIAACAKANRHSCHHLLLQIRYFEVAEYSVLHCFSKDSSLMA